MQDQSVDLTPPAISTKSFRTVRKGYDPDEVQTYLTNLELALIRASEAATPPPSVAAVAQADDIIQAAQVQADTMVRDAEARAAAITVPATPATSSEATGPGATSRTGEVDETRSLEGSESALAVELEGGTDRWQAVGEHVGRVFQQAEAEARHIVDAAKEQVAADTAQASADRAEAAETLRAAHAGAAEIIASAEARAAVVEGDAVPRARAHADAVLIQARADLDASRSDLRVVLDHLEQVQALASRSLAARADLADLEAADAFLPDPITDDASTGDASTDDASTGDGDDGSPSTDDAHQVPGDVGDTDTGTDSAGSAGAGAEALQEAGQPVPVVVPPAELAPSVKRGWRSSRR